MKKKERRRRRRRRRRRWQKNLGTKVVSVNAV